MPWRFGFAVRGAAVLALGVMLSLPVSAASIANGGFESGANAPLASNSVNFAIGSTAIDGWIVVNNDGSVTNNGHNVSWDGNGAFGITTPFGTDFLDLTGLTDTKPFDGVSQTISTVAGQAYVLTFDVGAGHNDAEFVSPVSVQASAGAASATFTYAGAAGTVSNRVIWGDETLNFTAAAAATTITIVAETGVNFVGLDNVAVNLAAPAPVAVPEPISIAMLGTGLAGLCLVGRRRA